MNNNFDKKICFIVDCLSKGGAEKIAGRLSIALSRRGYNVFIISLRDDITYSYEAKLINLGKNESPLKLIKQLKKLILFRKYYKQIDADIYIDFRMRNRLLMEAFLHFTVFKRNKMVMRINNFNIHYHMPNSKKIFRIYNSSKAVVSISDDISKELKNIYPFKNLVQIPNFYSDEILQLAYERKDIKNGDYVLAVGRLLNKAKQFDKLILTYKETKISKLGIPLFILGVGPDVDNLERLILDNNLSDKVKLIGFQENPYVFIKHSKFLVLSSIEEGFPNVVLESLAIGTPVISFDCKSGPSEMIVNKHNGILVEDQNFDALKQAMDLLFENKELYNHCRINASKSVDKFKEENVVIMWEKLFQDK